jgi:hypothetical protein
VSADRSSEFRPAEASASEITESAARASEPRWSELRESAQSVSYAVAMPAAGEEPAEVTHPAEVPAVSVDFAVWSSDELKPGDAVASLPPIFMTMVSGGRTYYYFEDVYYAAATEADGTTVYEVVAPPVGARFNRLPADAEEVEAGSAVYYTSHDVYYIWADGGYVVVESPAPE